MRIKGLHTILFIGFAGLLASCSTSPRPAPASESSTPAAPGGLSGSQGIPIPDGNGVSSKDFWQRLASVPEDGAEGGVAFEAFDRRVSQAEYDAGFAAFLNGRARTSELEDAYRESLAHELLILRWLEKRAASVDGTFHAQARQRLRETLAHLVIEQELATVTIEDADVRRLYEQRIADYSEPEKVQVRMILVPAEEEAREILELLQQGTPFGSLARERSRHDSRNQSGELPPFERGASNRDFEEKAFALQPGETGIVTTGAGTFVIQKIANIASRTIPFEEVKSGLRVELESAARRERQAALLDRLRSEIGITPTAGEASN